ncbi:MAG: hypothetical protein IT210_11950 [Armatimonadetes bacterium]|nr:hypothetical protein [Armatimonadota bacterium]
MPDPPQEREIVRSLARRVAEIAALPAQQERIELWTRLNRLERVRPPIHIQALDANIWEDLIPPSTLVATDPFLRGQELMLRKRIYAWEEFQDDRVTDDIVVCPLVVEGMDLGIHEEVDQSDMRWGAHAYRSVIAEERDIEKIQVEQEVRVNVEETLLRQARLSELYEGILRVETRGPDFFWFAPMDQFATWRGIQQMFVDLLDRPRWVCEALERITAAHTNRIEQLERLNVLSPGHRNTMLGSGGYGWTDRLPGPDFDGRHVRLKDLWARAATQIFTEGISPAMHEEFAIRYEKRLLECFGLSCYGCCEPLHRKMGVVRNIRNLRRVSMSPWVDIAAASEAVGKDYIYTHKPNPTIVSMEEWHPDLARRQLRDALEKTRDNVVEINLQDLHTVRGESRRLTEWSRIARRLAEEYA